MIKRFGKQIILENDLVKIIVEPETGAKIRSFISKATNWDFLFQVKRAEFSDEGYSFRDFSGFEDCFPTIAPCEFTSASGKSFSYADHGYLWQNPWKAEIQDDTINLTKNIAEISCAFKKSFKLQSQNTLKIDYRIKNNGPDKLPFIYSAHPLLAANEYTRLILPEETSKIYMSISSENSGFEDKRWIDMPTDNDRALLGPFSGKNDMFVKYVTDKLTNGTACVKQLDTAESLVFNFDVQTLPYLGCLAVEGIDILGNGDFKDIVFLGLEPTTGIGEDLATCESTHSLEELATGEELNFWISLTLKTE